MRISRRQFIRGTAAASAGLLGAPAILRNRATAQMPGPKRLVCVFTHNQMPSSHWLPSGGETDFTLSPILAPLDPFRDKLLVLHNLASQFHDHGPGTSSALSEAAGDGPSIDQVVAQRLGNTTRIRSLELGVQTNGHSVFYGGPRLPVPTIDNPHTAYNRILAATENDPVAQARLSTQTGLALDAVATRYEHLQSRIHTSERRLVDAHVSELAALRQRIAQPAMVRACGTPTPPTVPPGSVLVRDETLFPDVARAQIDNIVAALTCDVTRVAGLMFSQGGACTATRGSPPRSLKPRMTSPMGS